MTRIISSRLEKEGEGQVEEREGRTRLDARAAVRELLRNERRRHDREPGTAVLRTS